MISYNEKTEILKLNVAKVRQSNLRKKSYSCCKRYFTQSVFEKFVFYTETNGIFATIFFKDRYKNQYPSRRKFNF